MFECGPNDGADVLLAARDEVHLAIEIRANVPGSDAANAAVGQEVVELPQDPGLRRVLGAAGLLERHEVHERRTQGASKDEGAAHRSTLGHSAAIRPRATMSTLP